MRFSTTTWATALTSLALGANALSCHAPAPEPETKPAPAFAAPKQTSKKMFHISPFSASNIIEKNVLIIGAGSSGTYAATELLDAGKSVLVVEKEVITGGNTNTYRDASGAAVDYRVVI